MTTSKNDTTKEEENSSVGSQTTPANDPVPTKRKRKRKTKKTTTTPQTGTPHTKQTATSTPTKTTTEKQHTGEKNKHDILEKETHTHKKQENDLLAGIDNLDEYIANKKATSSLHQKKKEESGGFTAADGSNLLNIPDLYAIVPHSKGDHKLVYLKGNEPGGLLDDPKQRTPGNMYIKNGHDIYMVTLTMKEHPTLKDQHGASYDVWIIDTPEQLTAQMDAIKQGKGGGENFGDILFLGAIQTNNSEPSQEISNTTDSLIVEDSPVQEELITDFELDGIETDTALPKNNEDAIDITIPTEELTPNLDENNIPISDNNDIGASLVSTNETSEPETDSATTLDFDDTEEKQEDEPIVSSLKDEQNEEKSTLFGASTPADISTPEETTIPEEPTQGMFRDPNNIPPTTSSKYAEENSIPLSQDNDSSPEQVFTSPFASMDTTPGNNQTIQEDLPKEPGTLNIDDLVIESPEENIVATEKTSSLGGTGSALNTTATPKKTAFPTSIIIRIVLFLVIVGFLFLIIKVMFPTIKGAKPSDDTQLMTGEVVDEGGELIPSDEPLADNEENTMGTGDNTIIPQDENTIVPQEGNTEIPEEVPLPENNTLTLNELTEKLKIQQTEARKVLNVAKLLENKQAIKFSLAAMLKAGNALERIETEPTITAEDVLSETEKIDRYLADANKLIE